MYASAGTASVGFAKRTKFYASTLGDHHFVWVRFAGREGHCYTNGVHQTSRVIMQQLELWRKKTVGHLHLQAIHQHHRGSCVYGVNMEEETQYLPCLVVCDIGR